MSRVQGPDARAAAASGAVAAGVPAFRVADVEWEGVRACRRHGLHGRGRRRGAPCRPSAAAELWDGRARRRRRRRPGSARATRSDSRPALPLHGHELGPGITPLQAGLGWVVAWDKGVVPGARARWPPNASGASPAACGACHAKAAGRPAPSRRCSSTARWSARSRAATSRRCSAARHRSRLRAARRRGRAPRSRSTSAATALPARGREDPLRHPLAPTPTVLRRESRQM